MTRGKRGLRITGGSLRGRSLSVAPGVRPSGARLREALFDVWQDRVEGARVLDLFAGCGAVGLEALSRGASEVVLVENELAVLRHLRRNCRYADPAAAKVVRLDLPSGLRRLAAKGVSSFDLIFADPPYPFSRFAELLTELGPFLAPAGEAAIEHRRGVELPEAAGGLARVECRRYGDSLLSFYRQETPC